MGLNSWVYNTWAVVIIFLQYHRFLKLTPNQLCITFFLSETIFLTQPFFRPLTLPISLWVGTINWHPPLFYCVIITYASTQIKKNLSYTNLLVKAPYFSQIKMLGFTLLLGGLWGLQSLTWGYFWVNDGIEWSLLLIVTLVIIYQHSIQYRHTIFFWSENLWSILVALLLLRLNLLPTRHAFLTTTPVVYKLILIYGFSACNYKEKPLNVLGKNYQCQNLLNYTFYLTVLLFGFKTWIGLAFKFLGTSLIVTLSPLVSNIRFGLKKFVLHYIFLFLFGVWTMTYSMFTLIFFNGKTTQTNPESLYKLLYSAQNQFISQKNFLKTLLEKMSMYSTLNMSAQLSLSSNLFYVLICINTLKFLLLLVCLIF